MNTISILGISVPFIFLIYIIIRLLGKIQDDKIDRKIRDMTSKEKEEYLNSLKEDSENQIKKSATFFEKIVMIVAFGLIGILVIGGIIGTIYFLIK